MRKNGGFGERIRGLKIKRLRFAAPGRRKIRFNFMQFWHAYFQEVVKNLLLVAGNESTDPTRLALFTPHTHDC